MYQQKKQARTTNVNVSQIQNPIYHIRLVIGCGGAGAGAKFHSSAASDSATEVKAKVTSRSQVRCLTEKGMHGIASTLLMQELRKTCYKVYLFSFSRSFVRNTEQQVTRKSIGFGATWGMPQASP